MGTRFLAEEYERLVIVADDLYRRIEACNRVVESALVEVYHGERDAEEAFLLTRTVAEIQADLLQQLYHVRLQKTIMARRIDGIHPFH